MRMQNRSAVVCGPSPTDEKTLSLASPLSAINQQLERKGALRSAGRGEGKFRSEMKAMRINFFGFVSAFENFLTALHHCHCGWPQALETALMLALISWKAPRASSKLFLSLRIFTAALKGSLVMCVLFLVIIWEVLRSKEIWRTSPAALRHVSLRCWINLACVTLSGHCLSAASYFISTQLVSLKVFFENGEFYKLWKTIKLLIRPNLHNLTWWCKAISFNRPTSWKYMLHKQTRQHFWTV